MAKSTNSSALGDVLSIVQQLVGRELQADHSADNAGRAAFRVCEKLRQPLSSLIGRAGFRSLFSRALALAKGEVPWLGGVEIGVDGTLEFSKVNETQLDGHEAARGGAALLTQLLGLLITFIGEALTLRLVYNIWPKAAPSRPGAKENTHEKTP